MVFRRRAINRPDQGVDHQQTSGNKQRPFADRIDDQKNEKDDLNDGFCSRLANPVEIEQIGKTIAFFLIRLVVYIDRNRQ